MRRGYGARGAALAVATLLMFLVAGCAGSGQVEGQFAAADGDNASLRGILLRDVFVLGPEPGETISVDGSTQIYLTLVNERNEVDHLVSAAAPGTARSVEIPGGRLALPVGEPVRSSQDGRTLVMQGLTRELRGGEYVRLTFGFEAAGTVEISAPVMPYAEFYTTYPAPTSPTPSPTASPTPSPTGSPPRSPTGSPTDSPGP